MSKRIKIMKGKHTADLSSKTSHNLSQQLGSLHGNELGPLHVGHSSVASSICGAFNSGARIYL